MADHIPSGTVTETPSGGKLYHGKPGNRGFGWFRIDWFEPAEKGPGREGAFNRYRAGSWSDDSPGYHGPYNADCAWCWLNYGHTTEAHELELLKKAKGSEA